MRENQFCDGCGCVDHCQVSHGARRGKGFGGGTIELSFGFDLVFDLVLGVIGLGSKSFFGSGSTVTTGTRLEFIFRLAFLSE